MAWDQVNVLSTLLALLGALAILLALPANRAADAAGQGWSPRYFTLVM
jgi:hypothetical protein